MPHPACAAVVLSLSFPEQWLNCLGYLPAHMDVHFSNANQPFPLPSLLTPTITRDDVLVVASSSPACRFLGLHNFLQGYQIPKGWNVIYSICDTHDVADNFTSKEEFNPDRFIPSHPEDSSRFTFIPFGGGPRSCVGKEFAKVLLKIFTVELARHCDWQLLNGPPTMKTSPTVYPVDNLPARFTHFRGDI